MACCLIHNLIRREIPMDEFLPEDNYEDGPVNLVSPQESRMIEFVDSSDYWVVQRKELADQMWERWTARRRRRIIDTALLIFDHMKDLKCEPDTITFNTVLAILGRAGRVDEFLHQFSSMKETDMVPDIVSYNTLITSLRKLGRMDLCLVFLQEMCERGLKPDLLTYTALIEGFGRLGHTEEALRLFGDMKTRGVRPSIYIYRGLN
ncbi:pentatricopeptide repeat-containing protein At1g11900-like [Papaver somniferum]|uniref:pentatricopeptide repeat-containing protein At1g11900-like n=1 Tax=Papaver somniferum TaxID=3469 RepID=UPI000E6F5638|nr:pentatricopeptide repeat-containing protein At1g11900-like [Papaver somniferum]